MHEILASVTFANPLDLTRRIETVGPVDTGSAFPVLPVGWKDRLGPFPDCRPHRLETADLRVVEGEFCDPLTVTVHGFSPVSSEVLFLPIAGDQGSAVPIIGHLVLQQAAIIVDLVTHKLFHRPTTPLKARRA